MQAVARRAIATYLNVPVYAAFHEWLGRGDELGPMWSAWKSGDRKAAIEEIPDHLVERRDMSLEADEPVDEATAADYLAKIRARLQEKQ